MLGLSECFREQDQREMEGKFRLFSLPYIAFSTSSGTLAVFSETLAWPSRCQIRYILLHYLVYYSASKDLWTWSLKGKENK